MNMHNVYNGPAGGGFWGLLSFASSLLEMQSRKNPAPLEHILSFQPVPVDGP